MLHESTHLQIDLADDQVVSLNRVRGYELRCVHGRLWVTEEGNGRDILLHAGERLSLTRSGRTVVQAIGAPAGASCRLLLPKVPFFLSSLLRYRVAAVSPGRVNLRLVASRMI